MCNAWQTCMNINYPISYVEKVTTCLYTQKFQKITLKIQEKACQNSAAWKWKIANRENYLRNILRVPGQISQNGDFYSNDASSL